MKHPGEYSHGIDSDKLVALLSSMMKDHDKLVALLSSMVKDHEKLQKRVEVLEAEVARQKKFDQEQTKTVADLAANRVKS